MELGSYFLFLQEHIKDIIMSASVRMWAGGCNLWLPSSSFALPK